MFTGIVQSVGHVAALEMSSGRARLAVAAPKWAHRPSVGESIAVNGCCLSIAEEVAKADALTFDVITQTLAATTLGDLKPSQPVNLEHAVTPSTMLGGHIVQGHIDGVGLVTSVAELPGERRVRVQPPGDLLDAIVEKGSIAMDGVSLTVAKLGETGGAGWFEVALIPTTLQHTTLGTLGEGDRVNLETDYVAKTVVHWLNRRGGAGDR